MIPPEDLMTLPLYIDGSDGSMWPARESEEQWRLALEGGEEFSSRRFVKLSDLIRLLTELADRASLPK